MLTIRTRNHDPFHVVGDLRRQLDWFLGADPFFGGLTARTAAVPRFVATRNEEGLLLQADLPGLTREDLTLSVEDGVLRIAGGREFETPEGYRAVRRERVMGSFERAYELPEDVDPSAAEAKFTDGVLTVSLPLRPEKQPKTIEIQVA